MSEYDDGIFSLNAAHQEEQVGDSHQRQKLDTAIEIIRKKEIEWHLQSEIKRSTLLTYQSAYRHYAAARESARLSGTEFHYYVENQSSRNVVVAAIERYILLRTKRAVLISDAVALAIIRDSIATDIRIVSELKSSHKKIDFEKEKPFDFWREKLALLERYHPNWREELVKKMSRSKYYDCVLVQSICGCRTEELLSGVVITLTESGDCILGVKTAKMRAGDDSTSMRYIRSSDSRLRSLAGTVRLSLPSSDDMTNWERACAERKVKNNFRQTITNLSERLFGIGITPKAFRCGVASDLRSVGASTTEVSEFLGHASTACANTYSARLNSRGRARRVPAQLETARVQVFSRPMSEQLLARSRTPGFCP